MNTIILLFVAVIFVEAVVEIEVESEIFAGFRNKLAKIRGRIGWYLNGLFSCGYCLSVWVSAIAALFVPITIIDNVWLSNFCDIPNCVVLIVDTVFKTFLIHRLSNIWHEVVYRWLGRIPFVLAFRPSSDNKEIELDTEVQGNQEEGNNLGAGTPRASEKLPTDKLITG